MRTGLSDCVNEVTALAVKLGKQNPGLRNGQALMNALREWSPQLYQDITATDADPFYRDDLIPAFWMRVGERLQIYAEREAQDGGQTEEI